MAENSGESHNTEAWAKTREPQQNYRVTFGPKLYDIRGDLKRFSERFFHTYDEASALSKRLLSEQGKKQDMNNTDVMIFGSDRTIVRSELAPESELRIEGTISVQKLDGMQEALQSRYDELMSMGDTRQADAVQRLMQRSSDGRAYFSELYGPNSRKYSVDPVTMNALQALLDQTILDTEHVISGGYLESEYTEEEWAEMHAPTENFSARQDGKPGSGIEVDDFIDEQPVWSPIKGAKNDKDIKVSEEEAAVAPPRATTGGPTFQPTPFMDASELLDDSGATLDAGNEALTGQLGAEDDPDEDGGGRFLRDLGGAARVAGGRIGDAFREAQATRERQRQMEREEKIRQLTTQIEQLEGIIDTLSLGTDGNSGGLTGLDREMMMEESREELVDLIDSVVGMVKLDVGTKRPISKSSMDNLLARRRDRENRGLPTTDIDAMLNRSYVLRVA